MALYQAGLGLPEDYGRVDRQSNQKPHMVCSVSESKYPQTELKHIQTEQSCSSQRRAHHETSIFFTNKWIFHVVMSL